MKDNPYIDAESPFDGYTDSINELRNQRKFIEFDRLCNAVLTTPDGKLLVEELQKRYLMPGFVNPASSQATNIALYYEGFKAAFRLIIDCSNAHDERIKHHELKNLENNKG